MSGCRVFSGNEITGELCRKLMASFKNALENLFQESKKNLASQSAGFSEGLSYLYENRYNSNQFAYRSRPAFS
jgi:hypothetical protein